jgi:hypothetical protein
MKRTKLLTALSLSLLALLGGLVVLAGDDDDDDDDHKSRNSFALFNTFADEEGGALCQAKKGKGFTYHVVVTNRSEEAGSVAVHYRDGRVLVLPIAAQATLSFSQAAGSKGGADRAVRISNGSSGAELAGVMSAEGATCRSCEPVPDGIGDEACDEIVETVPTP